MKHPFHILTLWLLILSAGSINAQQRCAILSTQAFTGNRSSGIARPVIRTPDGGFILQLWSQCSTGNFHTGICLTDTLWGETQLLKYRADGTMEATLHCFDDRVSNISGSTLAIYPLGNGTFLKAESAARSAIATKMAADGTIVWSKGYGSTQGSTIGQDACRMADSGFVIACESYGTGGDVGTHYGSPFSCDVFVVRVDSSGNKIWTRTFGGTYNENVRAVVPAPDDGVYVIGFTRSNDYDFSGLLHNVPNQAADGYVVRLDSTGNFLWKRCYGGSSGELFLAVCPNEKGGLLAVGYATSRDGDLTGFKGTNQILWVMDIDSSGNINWNKAYGSIAPGAYHEPHAVCCRQDDGTYWVAATSSDQGDEVDTAYGKGDTWILHLSNSGAFINSRVLGSPNGGSGPSMITPTASGVIVAGYYRAVGGTMPAIFFPDLWEYSGYLIRLSSSSVSVPETKPPSAPGLSAYPNPAKDALYVSVQDVSQNSGQVWLSNSAGQRVTQKTATRGTQKITISCGHLPPGAYIVQYENSRGNRRQQKIILE